MATLGNMALGSTVYLYNNGVATPFTIIQHGKPSTMYDDSCNDTWLMQTNAIKNRKWDNDDNDYMNSDIHEYLNSTYLSAFEPDIQRTIKTVKIPYWNGTGTSGAVASGTNGLECKAFLLAVREFSDSTASFLPHDGAKLDYTFTGSFTNFAFRSPETDNDQNIMMRTSYITTKEASYNAFWFHPVVILPGKCEVDSGGNVVSKITLNGSAIIGGSTKNLEKAYANIGGEWKEIIESYTNIGGEWKPTM